MLAVDLSQYYALNPTINNAEFVLQPGTFDYGLYRIVYTVTMQSPPGIVLAHINSFQSQAITNLRIAASGIVVKAIAGTTSQIHIGTAQALSLDPVLYSYDIDGVASMSALTFLFYCAVVDDGIESAYPMRSLGQPIDLRSFQTANLTMIVNSTCFDRNG